MCSRKQFRMNCFENLLDLIISNRFEIIRIHSEYTRLYFSNIKYDYCWFNKKSMLNPFFSSLSMDTRNLKYLEWYSWRKKIWGFGKIRNSLVTPWRSVSVFSCGSSLCQVQGVHMTARLDHVMINDVITLDKNRFTKKRAKNRNFSNYHSNFAVYTGGYTGRLFFNSVRQGNQFNRILPFWLTHRPVRLCIVAKMHLL